MLALIVFSHALRFFKDHCLQELSDQSSTRIVNDDIRWVITVPAIWRQPAKQFMRQAAYEVSTKGQLSVYICGQALYMACVYTPYIRGIGRNSEKGGGGGGGAE